MSCTVGDVYKALDKLAPFDTAQDWDNVGILVGSPRLPAGHILLALDVTGAVIEEARRLDARLLVTHHPAIFGPIRSIAEESLLYQLIRAEISVISAHTNLDAAFCGVSDALAGRLGLSEIAPLEVVLRRPFLKLCVFVPKTHAEAVYQAMFLAGAGTLGNYSGCGFFTPGEGRFLPGEGACPVLGSIGRVERVEEVRLEMILSPENREAVLSAMKSAHPYELPAYDLFENQAVCREFAFGRVGSLPAPMLPAELALLVKERLCAGGIRLVPGGGPISRVAVCGGSGAEYLARAKAAGAQALVTAEAKHHLLLEAERLGMTLIDAGHFATENPALKPLAEQLRRLLPGARISLSDSCADPVRYL